MQLLSNQPARLVTATILEDTGHCIFFITYRYSGHRFLVDAGADVSIVPPTPSEKRHRKPEYILQSVTTSRLPLTVSAQSLSTLVSGVYFDGSSSAPTFLMPLLERTSCNSLTSCLIFRRRCLVDKATSLAVRGSVYTIAIVSPTICLPSADPFGDILKDFPGVTRQTHATTPPRYTVPNHIVTKGPSVSARPRRLAPQRLAIAEKEFDHMLEPMVSFGLLRAHGPLPSTCFPNLLRETGVLAETTAP
ncbi:uncharacterized protein LOC135384746 [Ornithodoros turicata]|uniref:uncharacterized protein LOC135384746 n=1 Tax=Ornithodoros turicata TaxID=34597 RepID=UPI003138940D